MKEVLRQPIGNMSQGLAHWMAFRSELSNIQVIESDVVLVASDMLRSSLPSGYIVEKEVTKKTLSSLKDKQRIDLGIKRDTKYECLIEFKLADATNAGYQGDVLKLNKIKQKNQDIDCLVVILYRKSTSFLSPKNLVGKDGSATRKTIPIKGVNCKVRRVCNSFTSKNNPRSKKTICIEVM